MNKQTRNALIGFPIPATAQKIYMVIVALIALYMIVALLLGIPSVRIIGEIEQGANYASRQSWPFNQESGVL